MNFTNRVVLITGGSSGIGAACVKHFAGLGARIAILDKVPPAGCDSALVTLGDITDPAVREHAVAATLERYGAIDILVNNVAVGLYEWPSINSSDDVLEVFRTNVFSAVALSQLVIPYMRSKREGWIANISSVGAYVGLPWSAAYCASKSAIHSYSESLRRELRSYGIHVSTVVPGIVRTGFRENVIGGTAPPGVAQIRQSVSAEEVAASVVRSIAQRKRRIFVPWYGRVFTGLDFLLPGIMDAYIRRTADAERVLAAEARSRKQAV
jgi:NAD(P)-dependent dehydrogenase (short-subunit alcohol dehydrogenase family)